MALMQRFPAVLCVATAFVAISAASQTDTIHIQPGAENKAAAPAAGERLSLHVAPLRVDVDLVLVPVTVTDSMSRPVLGLNKSDFAVFEGGVQKEIRYFAAEDAPISIGVLLDVSRSMSDKIDVAREALGQFFQTCNQDDDYFVITFADRPEMIADATRSIGTIQAKLAGVKPQGHTALLDAIYLGMHKLQSARYKRRALLIISDGGDNHSRFSASELKSAIMESDVQVYAIGVYSRIFKTPEEWHGERLLRQITEATGGHSITIGNARELPDAAAAISVELRNQYVIGYAAGSGEGGQYRRIRVQIAPRENAQPMQIYWKKGYMAPGQ